MEYFKAVKTSVTVLLFMAACTMADNTDSISNVIVNGQIALKPIPYQLYLTNGFGGCGMCLIERDFALTAKHCVEELCRGHGGSRIIAGVSDLRDEHQGFSRIVDEDEIKVHPTEDIALVHLKDPLPIIAGQIEPIKINDKVRNLEHGTMVTVSGFGATEKEASSPVLRKLALPIHGLLTNFGKRNAIIQLQAGPKQKSVCFGDSGGPGVALHKGVPMLVGVTSYVQGTEPDPDGKKLPCGPDKKQRAYGSHLVNVLPLTPWINRSMKEFTSGIHQEDNVSVQTDTTVQYCLAFAILAIAIPSLIFFMRSSFPSNGATETLSQIMVRATHGNDRIKIEPGKGMVLDFYDGAGKSLYIVDNIKSSGIILATPLILFEHSDTNTKWRRVLEENLVLEESIGEKWMKLLWFAQNKYAPQISLNTELKEHKKYLVSVVKDKPKALMDGTLEFKGDPLNS